MPGARTASTVHTWLAGSAVVARPGTPGGPVTAASDVCSVLIGPAAILATGWAPGRRVHRRGRSVGPAGGVGGGAAGAGAVGEGVGGVGVGGVPGGGGGRRVAVRAAQRCVRRVAGRPMSQLDRWGRSGRRVDRRGG